MFTKKADKEPLIEAGKNTLNSLHAAGGRQAPTSRPGGAARGARPGTMPGATAGASSVIGPDLTITGNLESQGEIQIEGEVQGDINAARIVVGEGACITGSLLADNVIVRGNIAGSIRGNSVTLQSNCRVEGDVFHRSLAIEQGAFFEGKSRRSEDPTAVQRMAGGIPPPA
jgi:cytoskeletal protein CcmA (bactofilin family)